MERARGELADVVGAWVRGWARARGVRAVEVRPGAWHARLDAESRREEYVLASPSVGDLAALAAQHRGDDRVWVTAMPPPLDVPAGLDVLAHAEALMSRRLDDVAAPVRPGLAAEHLHDDPSVVHVSYGVDGERAARGVVSVIGEVAVFDKILTEDGLRRQGYGRDVMTALTLEARSRGATRALLVASPEGQALYGSLGWSTLRPVHTFAPNRGPRGFTPGRRSGTLD